MSDRDPAAIHPTGLGLTLPQVIADYSTLSAFPTAGIAGRLGKATDTGIIYRDTAAAWEVWVTPSAGASFPITVDTGTYTFTIDASALLNELIIKSVLDAGAVLQGSIEVEHDGYLQFTSIRGMDVHITGGGALTLRDFNGGGIFLQDHNGGGIFIDNSGDHGGTFLKHSGGLFFVTADLPTSDPGVSGQVWNSGGTLKISP